MLGVKIKSSILKFIGQQKDVAGIAGSFTLLVIPKIFKPKSSFRLKVRLMSLHGLGISPASIITNEQIATLRSEMRSCKRIPLS